MPIFLSYSSTSQLRNINVPAIVSGTIGATVLIAALFAVFLSIRRGRTKTQDARISFHRDMMVRRSPDAPGPPILRPRGPGTTPYPFTIPGSTIGSIPANTTASIDLERGLGEPSAAVPAEP